MDHSTAADVKNLIVTVGKELLQLYQRRDFYEAHQVAMVIMRERVPHEIADLPRAVFLREKDYHQMGTVGSMEYRHARGVVADAFGVHRKDLHGDPSLCQLNSRQRAAMQHIVNGLEIPAEMAIRASADIAMREFLTPEITASVVQSSVESGVIEEAASAVVDMVAGALGSL